MTDYPNRSDLRNPATRKVNFTGQTYGQASAQAASQAQVPPGSSPSQVQAQRQASAQRPRPGAQPLTGPTQRPDEPVTAGAPFGAGSSMAPVPQQLVPYDDVLETLKMLYQMYPNGGVERLLSKYIEQNF
jgi:hypothetical protein